MSCSDQNTSVCLFLQICNVIFVLEHNISILHAKKYCMGWRQIFAHKSRKSPQQHHQKVLKILLKKLNIQIVCPLTMFYLMARDTYSANIASPKQRHYSSRHNLSMSLQYIITFASNPSNHHPIHWA